MAVTVEIECHDPSGLTLPYPYKEEKYKEYSDRLQNAMLSQCGDQQIDIDWHVNPVQRGMAVVEGMQNWYWQKRGGVACKVRYPRAGAFEVTVRCPANFAPASSGLPEQLEIWSKLRTHRWPDPEKLSAVVARVLARGRDSEDVSAAIQRIRQQCEGPTKPDATKRPATSTALVPMRIGAVSAPLQAPASPALRRTAPAAAAKHRAAAPPTGTAAAPPSGPAGQPKAPAAPRPASKTGQGARTASAPRARGPEAPRPPSRGASAAQPAAAQPRPSAARQAAAPQPPPAAPAAAAAPAPAAPPPAPAAAPATAAPTAASPTPAAPTAASPTPAAPTAASPTPAAPTADSPAPAAPTADSPAPAAPTADSPAPAPAAPASPAPAAPVEPSAPEPAPELGVGVGGGAAVGLGAPLLDDDLGGGDASDHEMMEEASRHLEAPGADADDYPDDFEDTVQGPLDVSASAAPAAPSAPLPAPEAPSPPARPSPASPADDYEDDFEQTLQGEPEVEVTESPALLKEVEQLKSKQERAPSEASAAGRDAERPAAAGPPALAPEAAAAPQPPPGAGSPSGRYDETEDFEPESDEEEDEFDDDGDELLDVSGGKQAALPEFRSSDSIDLVLGEGAGGAPAAAPIPLDEDGFEEDSVESLS